MAARKRAPAKPKSFASLSVNGSSAAGGNSKPPRTSTERISGGDLTIYLRLSILILLVLGLVGFLLYPDILNVLKTVKENTGLSGQTKKQDLQKEEQFIRQGKDMEHDENLTPDEDYYAITLDEETDHDNVVLSEHTEKQEFKQDEKKIHQKNSNQQDESLVLIDEDDAVVDQADHEDLMEEEEEDKQLKTITSAPLHILKIEKKQGETSHKDNEALHTEAPNKHAKTTNKQTQDKILSVDEHTKQGKTGNPQTDQNGKKRGPIILNAQNRHVVLDPTQIKIIDDSSEKNAEVKNRQSASNTQTSQNNNSKSNEKVKTEKQTQVKAEQSKTQKKAIKKSEAEMSNNEHGGQNTKNDNDVLDQTKDKIPSVDEHTKQGTTRNPQTDQNGKKRGPIILNAQNRHVVLDPTQVKIIDSAADKDAEVKNRHSASNTQTSQNNNNKSNEKVKTEKQTQVKSETKTQKKAIKKSEAEMSSNKHGNQNTETDDDILDKARKFNSTFQKTFTPKKIFADGRRIPPIELLHQKASNSSVRVFLFDDFLSKQECDGLIKAHDSHVKALSKPPILCFDSIATLRSHISDVKQNITVTPNDFTKGTKCVNASFSLQLQTWLNSNWSYSTAFLSRGEYLLEGEPTPTSEIVVIYVPKSRTISQCLRTCALIPSASLISLNTLKVISYRIKEAMGLDPASGGKFQITSYPEGKAYKDHTDCTLGGVDKRDRVVSVLMYLSDVQEGGETTFPHLGIWAKPKKGRALVWNNMSPDGVCEEHSKHVASVVKKGSKYILIRWYYYKTFYSLGRRPPPPPLPEREPDQAMVSCDEYNSGSCRWYDEWSYDSLLDYDRNKRTLI